jgi:hypothetical protein
MGIHYPKEMTDIFAVVTGAVYEYPKRLILIEEH